MNLQKDNKLNWKLAQYDHILYFSLRFWTPTASLAIFFHVIKHQLMVSHAYENLSSICRFVDQVNATIALLHPIHCMKDRNVDVVFDMTTIPAFVFVGGVLYFLLRPRRPKPKIN